MLTLLSVVFVIIYGALATQGRNFLVTMALCGVTACVCYIAGKNDAYDLCG